MKYNALDRIFSQYIRLRDSNEAGYVKCISCGKIVFWKESDCGHYVNRSHVSLRFDEKNCNAQCRSCNRFDEGNNIGYTHGLIRKYGSSVIDILLVKKHSVSRLSEAEIKILVNHYKAEVKTLKKEKGL